MADFCPVVFSLAQVAQAAGLLHLSGRVSRSLTQRPRPFSHVVCLPGDVVCVALPAGLSEAEVALLTAEADRFQDETGARMCIFKGGVQILGVGHTPQTQEATHG
ncbi:hypothetical protein [Delftia tsuruhatensis]|uniref:hypothetical protein n=1 Tax=Delftia tsuruhatensis TaxID=180282 RepID=UPI002AD5009E|nr:hypothetical protein [Delftia tsuruhatensis]WQM81723.1 hypothetical protein RNT40_23890 [Delftia tsuruhatensis]